MAIQPREWEALVRWVSQQSKPFLPADAIRGAGLTSSKVSLRTVRGVLRQLGYTPGRQQGQSFLWWKTSSQPTVEARARKIMDLRAELDQAGAALASELERWESSLVALADAPPPLPPPPMISAPEGPCEGDTMAALAAGRQEGRQERETEILVFLDRRLSLLREGTQGHLQLWALKKTITGSNE